MSLSRRTLFGFFAGVAATPWTGPATAAQAPQTTSTTYTIHEIGYPSTGAILYADDFDWSAWSRLEEQP